MRSASYRAAAALLIALVFGPDWVHAGGVPRWLEDAMARPAPPGSDGAVAVVLHHERQVVLHPHARHETTTRRAIRVLRPEGASLARAVLPYFRGSSECTWLRTWTVDASGRVRRSLALRDAADVAAIEAGQLYTDYRMLVAGEADVRPGETFAFESVVEADPLFAQWQWSFREQTPVAYSRFALDPSGPVNVVAQVFGPDSVTLERDGDRRAWVARALPGRVDEPFAPANGQRDGGVRVAALPHESRDSGSGAAFRDWAEASRWVANLAAPAGAVTLALAERARALGAGGTDTLGRIRRIASYVQGLNYVARSERIGMGWGYRPHDAQEVLGIGYGDCKDKANLLATLFRAEGVEAWLVPVHSTDRDAVDSSWVSLQQFDHCVIAFRPPATYAGPLVELSGFGRLAFFDPTDPLTVLGDLPLTEQGSPGLLVAPEGGALLRLPRGAPGSSETTRTIVGTLDSSGTLQAVLLQRSTGQAARAEREARHSGGEADYRTRLGAWLPTHGALANVRSAATVEDTSSGHFELRVEYEAPSFARVHRDGMMTFRTTVVGRRSSWLPPDGPRESPIALWAECLAETLTLRPPRGYRIDERPADVRIESDLGRFEATWSERDGALVQAVRWELRPRTVGSDRWDDVRALFAARHAAGGRAVVLTRR